MFTALTPLLVLLLVLFALVIGTVSIVAARGIVKERRAAAEAANAKAARIWEMRKQAPTHPVFRNR